MRKIRYGNCYETSHWIKKKVAIKMLWLLLCLISTIGIAGCGNRKDSTSHMKENMNEEGSGDVQTEDETDNKVEDKAAQDSIENYMETIETRETTETEEPTKEITIKNKNAIEKGGSIYDCDLEADKANYDGHVDIIVGDRYYATQINDWYMNFDQYEGKVVEIEGYYINDFTPYDLIGRYGPSCPYCQGGYVSFEIMSDEDFSAYASAKDWIRVTGILRKGIDKLYGDFYYIEALKVEKMDAVGVDTVTD